MSSFFLGLSCSLYELQCTVWKDEDGEGQSNNFTLQTLPSKTDLRMSREPNFCLSNPYSDSKGLPVTVTTLSTPLSGPTYIYGNSSFSFQY